MKINIARWLPGVLLCLIQWVLEESPSTLTLARRVYLSTKQSLARWLRCMSDKRCNTRYKTALTIRNMSGMSLSYDILKAIVTIRNIENLFLKLHILLDKKNRKRVNTVLTMELRKILLGFKKCLDSCGRPIVSSTNTDECQGFRLI